MKEKEKHDNKAKERKLDIKERCSFETILRETNGHQKETGPVLFLVKLSHGRVGRCHQDKIRNHPVEVRNDSYFEPEILIHCLSLPQLQMKIQVPLTNPELLIQVQVYLMFQTLTLLHRKLARATVSSV